jgi:hypothetical protein
MRRHIALLAAVTTGMALIAAGLVGSHFGFDNWPMAPAPVTARDVTVEHPTLAVDDAVPAESAALTRDPVVTRRERKVRSATQPARGHKTFVDQQHTVRHHDDSGSAQTGSGGGSSGTTGDGDVSTPADDTPAATDTTPATPTTPATGSSPTTEVTPASADPAPSTTPDPAPAEPQPEQPAPSTPPASPAPAPTSPSTGGQSGHGTRHGPIRQLLHDLLGLRKIQN